MKTIYYVTGICGHLGRNILFELSKLENIEIVGLVFPGESTQNLETFKSLTLIEGDVLNKKDIKRFFEAKEHIKRIVIHCAGLISIYKKGDPKVTEVNYKGTQYMLEASKKYKVERFIYISSVDAIKSAPKGIKTKEIDIFNADYVEGVYGKSKALASEAVLNYNSTEIKTITIHPSAILGPNDPYNGPINTAIRKHLNGKLNTIVTGGYDLVDVRDVAKGVVKASLIENPKTSYILTGTPIKIKDLIKMCSKISGRKSYSFCLPSTFVKVFCPLIEWHYKVRKRKPLFTAYSMKCLHRNYLYDYSRAFEDLGYSPRSLEETLRDTIEWLTNN